MNDQEEMAIVEACMTDETPLVVNITIKDAWLLITALQLATRHPEMSVWLKDLLFDAANKFQVVVEDIHPEAHQLIERGWDTRYDVDSFDEYDGVIPDIEDEWFPDAFPDSDDDWLQFGEPDDPEGWDE